MNVLKRDLWVFIEIYQNTYIIFMKNVNKKTVSQ